MSMRIDLNSSPSEPPARPGLSSSSTEGPAFGELLRSLTEPTANTPSNRAPDLKPWADLPSYSQIKAEKQELRQQAIEQDEQRQEAYANSLEENQDKMEDLVDKWKDRSPYKSDPDQLIGEQDTNNQDITELAELEVNDDQADIVSDFEELPLESDHEQLGDSEGGNARQQQMFQEEADQSHTPESRDMNYQEIQALVDTALNSEKNLPARVRQILQELLQALLEGQRYLLDQTILIGLEEHEWKILFKMFPAHFYGGLIRQHRQSPLDLYQILQDLFKQTPPNHERQLELLSLWQAFFTQDQMPLPLHNWILNQPILIQDQELIHLLEIILHHHSQPPGALGRLWELALAYQHHPEKTQALFAISQNLLHGKALTEAQYDLLGRCIYERCYNLDLLFGDEIQNLIFQALKGHELKEEDLIQLLGSQQGVLSYLPYALLHPGLQALLDYVRSDLLGNEEQALQLLKEGQG